MTGRSRWARALVGGVLAAAVLAALGALTRVPHRTADAQHAWLRLSWRMRGERVEECRRLTPEEREALPVHMRRPEVCEGRVAPYRLRYAVNGVVLEDTLVVPAGAKQDRPIYVYREVPLVPGHHVIEVEFSRVGGGGGAAREAAAESSERPAAVAVAPSEQGAAPGAAEAVEVGGDVVAPAHRVALAQDFVVEAGHVVLVTLDAEGAALVLRRGGPDRR